MAIKNPEAITTSGTKNFRGTTLFTGRAGHSAGFHQILDKGSVVGSTYSLRLT
jgi:hypothetical protein